MLEKKNHNLSVPIILKHENALKELFESICVLKTNFFFFKRERMKESLVL